MPNLDSIEQQIYDYYQFFHLTAPGVPVREEGQLAQWWRFVDLNATPNN